MMFCFLQNHKYIRIFLLLEFMFNKNIVNSFSLLNKNNKFDDIKNNFIKEVEKNKLISYMKKTKLDVNKI